MGVGLSFYKCCAVPVEEFLKKKINAHMTSLALFALKLVCQLGWVVHLSLGMCQKVSFHEIINSILTICVENDLAIVEIGKLALLNKTYPSHF